MTSETSISLLAFTTLTLFCTSHSSTITPTLKELRNPVAASSKASLAAVVLANLNLPIIAPSICSKLTLLPIGRVRSCSSKSFTGDRSMLFSANIVRPADVLPLSLNATMRPSIILVSVSAAVISNGNSIFMIKIPLVVGLPLGSLHQCPQVFHKF